jgi:hypothetical protein
VQAVSKSELSLIKRWEEHVENKRVLDVPRGLRGIYVLYRHRKKKGSYDVVYVGMAGGKAGIRARLRRHVKNKAGLWTHFSIFEVWDNVSEEEIRELEGLFRQIYRLDQRANSLNKVKSFARLRRVPNILEAE